MTLSARSHRVVSTPLATLILAFAILSLRWPLRVSIETIRGTGHSDATIIAFVATFLMVCAGLPGVALLGFRPGIATGPGRPLVAASLLSLLVGCLGALVWIIASVRMIGVTLAPIQVVAQAFPPSVTALAAVWFRFRLRREGDDMQS